MYWIEIRSAVRRQGAPRLVPLADAGKYTGFRSVVAYDDATAEHIRTTRQTNGLRDVPVYADTLFMDFDNIEPVRFRTWLQQSGLAYEEWNTGHRSVHFHIPLSPVRGSWVTAAMKDWVLTNSPEQADTSFYHSSGQYRLPGTFHAKAPGKCKTLVAAQDGQTLVLVQPPPKVQTFSMPAEEGPERFFMMLTQTVGSGKRSQYAWRLAMQAAESGVEFNVALEHVHWWNSRWAHPPLGGHVIETQVLSAYRRVSGK